MSTMTRAQFHPGQFVLHRKFGYRGLIFDVDPCFTQSEEWYELMAPNKPAKERPWYHVLVDGETHTTYVAEENIELSLEVETPGFSHPLLHQFFNRTDQGALHCRYSLN